MAAAGGAIPSRVLMVGRFRCFIAVMMVIGSVFMHLVRGVMSHGHAKARSHCREPLEGYGECDCEHKK